MQTRHNLSTEKVFDFLSLHTPQKIRCDEKILFLISFLSLSLSNSDNSFYFWFYKHLINHPTQRIAGLTALEAQLKQKDDLIAVRDDEIQKLKLRLAMFERNVNNISAVFLQFPHSMEEMEMMIIENEEFRKMAGQNAELEERVRLRQLEIQARKQQQQQQGVANSIKAGVTGSLEAATAALLARTGDDSDSDDGSLLVPAQFYPNASR